MLKTHRSAAVLIPVLVPVLVIAAVTMAIYLTAPKSEDFWWTDAASFALNGELIHDYAASGFHQAPMAFANDWFRYYPAVTISLYPPIFPLAEAIAFGLFGFSHAVAQATVAAFTVLAAFGLFRTLRTAVDPFAACGGVALFFAVPGVLLWSRQVMMELPFIAFLLLAAWCLLRYQASRRARDLYLTVLLLLAASYTKQSAIFAMPAFAIALIADDGWRVLRDRTVWLAAVLGVVGLVPLAAFTIAAAPLMLDVALGQGVAAHFGTAGDAHHFAQALEYAAALPGVIGWPVLIAAVVYAATVILRGWASAAERRLAVLMLAWFGCGFVFISATAHFESRYADLLGAPCAVAATLLLARALGHRAAAWVIPGIALAVFAASLLTHSVNRMTGYDKVAAYILDHSRPGDAVWLQGSESKNLAFSLRSHGTVPKVTVIRAEKLLTDYHIIREMGIRDRGLGSATLHGLIDNGHVALVVLQPGFWSDLPSMRRMQDYILSLQFKQVAAFPITADEPSQRTTIEIFVRQAAN